MSGVWFFLIVNAFLALYFFVFRPRWAKNDPSARGPLSKSQILFFSFCTGSVAVFETALLITGDDLRELPLVLLASLTTLWLWWRARRAA